jgi:trans-2,3-dihydro-3-hydroxyanthranilate isomerase
MSASGRDSNAALNPAADTKARYVVVDVFTDTPLQGNQLAVFPEGARLPAELMQRLAREINFSETVFVLPAAGDGDARIRIFTPRHELPFAGHPVLGCAWVIGQALERTAIRLESGLGVIPVELERNDGKIVFGRMQQVVPSWAPYEHAGALLEALGLDRSALPIEAYPNGPFHVYVGLESEQAVARLEPDFAALARLGNVAANCFAGGGTSWKTRMFAPGGGVFEDPATGSAAGPLAIHLARHRRIAFGEQIEIRQGAEVGRPSLLYARAVGSAQRVERVEVGGSAVVVARGEFRLSGDSFEAGSPGRPRD